MTHPENDDQDRFVYGQVAKQTAVRIDQLGVLTRTDEVCDFMIDTHTHQIVQVGAEGAIAVEEIDFIKQVLEMSDAEIDELAARANRNDDDAGPSLSLEDSAEAVNPRPHAGPAVTKSSKPAKLGTGYFAQKPGDWTREEFVESIEDFSDRAFLLRLLELVDANDELPSAGPAPRLFFGKRPGGAMFVYHFGRRHPPYKFSIKKGQLMIAGCWTRFPQVEGDPGFADLASMLNLDEKKSAKAVPVSGLDPDEVWAVGETVSRAING